MNGSNSYQHSVIPVVRDRNYGIGFFGDRIAGVRPDGRTGCLPYGNPYGVAPPQYAECKTEFSIVQTGGIFRSVKAECKNRVFDCPNRGALSKRKGRTGSKLPRYDYLTHSKAASSRRTPKCPLARLGFLGDRVAGVRLTRKGRVPYGNRLRGWIFGESALSQICVTQFRVR